MYSFVELKKSAKQTLEGDCSKLAIVGNSATQFLGIAIKGLAVKEQLNMKILETDYNQVDIQLLDKNSDVYLFKPDYLLIYLSSEKLYEEFMDLPYSSKLEFAELYIDKITSYWCLIKELCGCKVLQFNFVEINDNCFGNYSSKIECSFIYQIRKLNYLLQEKEKNEKDVFPIDLLTIQNQIGRKEIFDSSIYYTAKVTFALGTLPFLAKQIIDVVKCIRGNGKKCIILDLDNTLWGGVIGDDGLGNIEIGELGRGPAFINFQRWLKMLKERGILLAVCSKNNESTAKEPFEKHEDMILRLSDITIFIANWNDKVNNIKDIQKCLNIGFDSMVFIDDSPFERNLVRQMLPDVTVPELPTDPAQYLSYLQESNLFESSSFSEEDANRTKQYQMENARKTLQSKFDNIDDYLRTLKMEGTVSPFCKIQYARIAQLTQRSNQFNLRTIRYTEGDIERITNDEKNITMCFSLKDKFGDHGIVSVIILEKINDDTIFINTWIMSCRVLKRGMEEFTINCMVDEVKKNGYTQIYGEYIPTVKNPIVKDIYIQMGFEQLDSNQFRLICQNYKCQKTMIRELQ